VEDEIKAWDQEGSISLSYFALNRSTSTVWRSISSRGVPRSVGDWIERLEWIECAVRACGFIGTAKLELRQLPRGQDTDLSDQIVFQPQSQR